MRIEYDNISSTLKLEILTKQSEKGDSYSEIIYIFTGEHQPESLLIGENQLNLRFTRKN